MFESSKALFSGTGPPTMSNICWVEVEKSCRTPAAVDRGASGLRPKVLPALLG